MQFLENLIKKYGYTLNNGVQIALTETRKEHEWLIDLLYEISLGTNDISSIPIACDSQITLAWAYNELYNKISRLMSLRL